jgi:GNAT superfamily N-acetyltransferase
MDVDIRRARGAEAGDLTSIAFAAKRHWGYPEDWMKLWQDELTVLPDYVEHNRVYVATSGERRLGWCAVTEQAGAHWLDYCWVLPEAAGMGIGRRLVGRAFELAAASRWPTLKVVADPNAEGFYRKLGFRRIGEWPSVPAGRRLPMLEADVAAKP